MRVGPVELCAACALPSKLAWGSFVAPIGGALSTVFPRARFLQSGGDFDGKSLPVEESGTCVSVCVSAH